MSSPGAPSEALRALAQDPRLESVQVGAGDRSTRVHVRLAEGRHAGLEIRGIYEHGQVRVELVPPAGPANTVDLAALRSSLAERPSGPVDVQLAAETADRDAPERPRPVWPEDEETL